MNGERWIYAGGKSGGHIIPALTLSRAAQMVGATVGMVALDRALDRSLVGEAPWLDACWFMPLDDIYPSRWKSYPRYGVSLLTTLWRLWRLMRQWHPTKIVITGGLVAVPITIIARLMRVPVAVYNLDAEPGRAVWTVAPYVQEVCCVFSEAAAVLQSRAPGRVRLVEYPLRFTAAQLPSRDAVCRKLQIPNRQVIIAVLGGSQGAQSLNDQVRTVWGIYPPQLRTCIWILHQTGGQGSYAASLQAWYTDQGYRATVLPYVVDIASWLAIADVIVTRAGSGALHEALQARAHLVVVPLILRSNQHQLANARAIAVHHPGRTTVVMPDDVNGLENVLKELVVSDIKRKNGDAL